LKKIHLKNGRNPKLPVEIDLLYPIFQRTDLLSGRTAVQILESAEMQKLTLGAGGLAHFLAVETRFSNESFSAS